MYSENEPVKEEHDVTLHTTASSSSSRVYKFSYMMIGEEDWNFQIQDAGTSNKSKMSNKTYRGKQIPPYGPNKIFYYQLSSITIDYMTSFKENAAEWCRVPKNTTNVKSKIIEVILQL